MTQDQERCCALIWKKNVFSLSIFTKKQDVHPKHDVTPGKKIFYKDAL